MSWRRVILVMLFDLRFRAFTWQGAFFLIPFLLVWYPLLRGFDRNASLWLSQDKGFFLVQGLLGPQTANTLFVEHPPLLSAFLLVMLYTAPFFAILAGCDQFASDLGNGFLRFLSVRCLRIEMFLGRYLSAFLMLVAAYVIAAALAAFMSVRVDQKPMQETLTYFAQVLLTTVSYTAPLVAFASIASAMTRSAVGALFLGMGGYVILLVVIGICGALWPDISEFSFLLPSGIRPHIFGINALMSSAAVAGLPLYTLAYGWIAWLIFRMRNF